MDNNRGIKSLQRDRKRIIILTKKQKKKLEEINEKNDEELKKLEKKVRQLQIITFIKTVPLIIVGAIFKSTANTIDNLITPTKKDLTATDKNKDIEDKEVIEEKIANNEKNSNITYNNTNDFYTIPDPTYYKEKENEKLEDKELENVKDKKLIKHYEEKLKEKRVEIKLLAASIPLSVGTDIYYEKADEIYKKINIVLSKLNDLEQKIKVDGNLYDDNYINYLVDSYTKEFDDGRLVVEIKNSELYRDISIKIEQLEEEKAKIKRLVSEKQKDLDSEEIINNETETTSYNINTTSKCPEEEKIIEEAPEETDNFSFDDEKKEYDKFLDQQEHIKIEEEREEAKTRSEIENYKLRIAAIKKQCESLKRMITKRSLVKPTIRNAKLITVTVLASIYNMRNILRNKKFRRRRKRLTRIEYTKAIENDPNEIGNVSILINKSYQQIDALISEIKTKFSSFNTIEYQSLISDLEEIKRILEEREYEIERVRKRQVNNDVKKYRK